MPRLTRSQLLENMFRIEKISDKSYRCNSPHMCGLLKNGRVFGGQLVAQAFRALQEHLGREIVPISMHYRFAAPGKGDIALDYEVETLENVARVTVTQNDKIIGIGIFRLSEDQLPPYGLELDYVLEPEELPDLATMAESLGAVGVARDLLTKEIIYDIRPIEIGRSPVGDTPRNLYWTRLQRDSVASVPSWCGIQAVLLLSDFLIIQIAEDIYSSHGHIMTTGASLAHSVRFHKRNHQIDPHGWFLYRVECEFLGFDRCKLLAKVYDEKREAVATVIQEGYTQTKRRDQPKL